MDNMFINSAVFAAMRDTYEEKLLDECGITEDLEELNPDANAEKIDELLKKYPSGGFMEFILDSTIKVNDAAIQEKNIPVVIATRDMLVRCRDILADIDKMPKGVNYNLEGMKQVIGDLSNCPDRFKDLYELAAGPNIRKIQEDMEKGQSIDWVFVFMMTYLLATMKNHEQYLGSCKQFDKQPLSEYQGIMAEAIKISAEIRVRNIAEIKMVTGRI